MKIILERYKNYLLPVSLAIVMIFAQILYFDKQSNPLVSGIPVTIIMIVTIIYAVITIYNLNKEDKDNSFWKLILGYLVVHLFARVFFDVFGPNFEITENVTAYMNSWMSIFMVFVNLFATALLIFALFKLVKILGIMSNKKEMIILKWMFVSSMIISSIALYDILYFHFIIEVALIIPFVIILFRNRCRLQKSAKFVMWSLFVMVLGFVSSVLSFLHSFIRQPVPEVFIIAHHVFSFSNQILAYLFYVFLMFAMVSRIEIAKNTEIEKVGNQE